MFKINIEINGTKRFLKLIFIILSQVANKTMNWSFEKLLDIKRVCHSSKDFFVWFKLWMKMAGTENNHLTEGKKKGMYSVKKEM